MGFESILDALDVAPEEKLKRPSFYEDLNLDKMIDVIARNNNTYDVKQYYYYFPANEVCEKYRREIYQDIKKPEINEALVSFCKKMYEMRQKIANKEKVNIVIQQKAWHVAAAAEYTEALTGLYEALSKASNLSHGMAKLQMYLKEVTGTDLFGKMAQQAEEIRRELKEVHFAVTIENERINVIKAEDTGEYENILTEFDEKNEMALKSPFGDGYDASMLEKAIYQVMAKSDPVLFNKMLNFEASYMEFVDDKFLRLEQELQFYLSYYKFSTEMMEHGCEFTMPKESCGTDIKVKALYDIMLAYTNCLLGKTVVSNDVEYNENEKFLIVSGPNQGGKTTFARSLGQMIYLKKMGLDIPAKEAMLPYYQHILTHFSVEESMETGCGKLKEELTRLRPMMEKEIEQAFVVINELFTTAANYDAYKMGEKVLKHFIDNNCQGVYVTHIKELADKNEQIVSLRAMLDEADYRLRTFKIIRSSQKNAGHAGDIAEKYDLSYEQLRHRLLQDS